MTDQLAITTNAYLDGRLTVRQPAKGYRAGVDPVLLAASVPAKPGQLVLELGCGVGTASLCLSYRINGLRMSAVELQGEYAALARENAIANNIEMEVHVGDLAKLPDTLRQQTFDHVIANPPYFDRTASTAAENQGREVAMGEATPLATWVDVAARRVSPKGYVSFIHRAERLPELLQEFSKRLGSIQLLPLQSRAGREAGLILLRGRKGGRADFRLHSPIIMHEGVRHERDGESYTPLLRAVLRSGEALPFPE